MNKVLKTLGIVGLVVAAGGATVATLAHFGKLGNFKVPGTDTIEIATHNWDKDEDDTNFTAQYNDTNFTAVLNYAADTKDFVKVPASVTHLGKTYAVSTIQFGAYKEEDGFEINPYMKALYVPDGVTNVNITAALNLKSVRLPSKGLETFNIYSCGFEEVSLPASVKSFVFKDCRSLKKCNLPEGTTNITENAFLGDYNLSSVNLPSTLTKIESFAFYGCVSLNNVTIPSGVTTIKDCAFENIGGFARVKADKPTIAGGSFNKDLPVFFDAYKANVTWASLATERTEADKKVYYKGQWKLVNDKPVVIQGAEAEVEKVVATTSASSSAAA